MIANQREVTNGCHFKTTSQNDQKSNQQRGPFMHMHTRYEVSMTICMGRRANQRKSIKMAAI